MVGATHDTGPVFVAATGPKMVELGAELADGVIGAFYSEHHIGTVVCSPASAVSATSRDRVVAGPLAERNNLTFDLIAG